MSPSSSSLLNPQAHRIFYPLPIFPSSASPGNFRSLRTVKFQKKLISPQLAFQSSNGAQADDLEEHVIGDCVVFEDGIFEDPVLEEDLNTENSGLDNVKPKSKKNVPVIVPENLVPDRWREAQAEINITKKERRKIAQEIEFNSRVLKKKQGMIPLRQMNLEEYKAFKEAKLTQLKPLVLDNPSSIPVKEKVPVGKEVGVTNESDSERLKPKNPRWAVYGRGLEDVSEFFSSDKYDPTEKNTDGQGHRKLFTKEEKVLLNKRIPDLAAATSEKWLPLHTLAASGEFYLVDSLLKHHVDINAVDKDGLTALHKAIIGKKQAIINYLLRNSANPFILDKEGATLMHYAVQTASSQTVKILLLYNVDINLQDNDGWTPLHVAVQAGRTDVVRLLLIKGADKTVKTKGGLTPLDLCLHSGQDLRTYELIKLLKQLPRR